MSTDIINGCDYKEVYMIEGRGMMPRPELVYTHALLLELKQHPLALIWPPYLDPSFKNSRGVWDPDRWHHHQKRAETPGEEEEKQRGGNRSRPASSLGDGIKGIEDAIILSPQRGSFLSGCAAASKDQELSLRPDQGGRRVGSGRILRQAEKPDSDFPSRGSRVGRNERDWGERGEASKYGFSRRGGADDDKLPPQRRGGWDDRREMFPPEGDRRRGRGGATAGGRRISTRQESEPEWMKEDVSLTDFIELKGFDEAGKNRSSRPNSRQSNKSDRGGGGHQKPPGHHQQPVAAMNPNASGGGGTGTASSEDDGFNFDQIMESVNLNSLLGGVACQEAAAAETKQTSRFSQFFQARPDQQAKARSRRSSIQEELLPLGSSILRELNGGGGEPVIKIPSPEESNKYFTPISPAAQTSQGENVLLDILQKGGGPAPPPPKSDRTVEKLEEGLRRSLGLDHQQQQQLHEQHRQLEQQLHQQQQLAAAHQQLQQQQQQQAGKQQQDNDLSAFKKLVSQVQGQPMDRGALPRFMPPAPGVVRPTPMGGLPLNAPTEQEILEGRGGGAAPPPPRMPRLPVIPPQLLQFLEHYPLNPEVLKRQETEHLINSINAGTFPLEQLVAQLSNPKLHPQQRDLVLTVLKLKTLQHQQQQHGFQQQPPPPAALQALFSAGPQMMPPQRTSPQPPPAQSRVSPLMFGGGGGFNPHLSVSPQPQNQRVPSPQEMTVLTQQILQQALIKKKLEEQKENYRKKQEGKPEKEEKEGGRGGSSKPGETAGSPLLAFTPTSVMRKNAADRKDSDPSPRVPEVKVTGMQEERDNSNSVMDKLIQIQQQQQQQAGQHSPGGRPILKGPANQDDRPSSLDLGGRSTRNNVGGRGGLPPQLAAAAAPPPAGLPGGMMGVPANNPLFFLNQLQGVPQPMMGGGINQFGGPGQQQRLAHHHQQLLHHQQQQHHHQQQHPPNNLLRMQGQTSPRGGGGGAVSPSAATPLSRFFPSEVLKAAAAGGGGMRHPPKMPPLPTGQALTLEEIERQVASAVKI